jgi:hypothetical protein
MHTIRKKKIKNPVKDLDPLIRISKKPTPTIYK